MFLKFRKSFIEKWFYIKKTKCDGASMIKNKKAVGRKSNNRQKVRVIGMWSAAL